MEEWNDKNPFYVSHGGFFKKPEVLKPGSCLKPGGFFSKAEFLKKDGRSCAKHVRARARESPCLPACLVCLPPSGPVV